MTFTDVLKFLTLVSSVGLSLALHGLLVRLRMPGVLAIMLGCATSTYAHHWFWIDLVDVNRPDRNAWLWIAGHPMVLIGGLCHEYASWKKRRRGVAGSG